MPDALADPADPANNRYAGYRLGYPREGSGSMAGVWRRLGGLVVDWVLAVGLANAFFGGDGLAISLLFVGITACSITLLGATFGHLLFGMRVTRLNGGAPGWWRPLARQALLAIVLPAIVWDTDHRGGHDIIAGLALRLR